MIDHQEDNLIDTDSGNKEPAFRKPKVKNFRTLQDDLIHAVQKDDHSIAKVVLSAREKVWRDRAEKETYKDPVAEKTKKTLLLQIVCIPIVCMVVFFLLKFLVHSNLFSISAQKNEPAQTLLIKPTKEIFLDVSNVDKKTFAMRFKKIMEKTALRNGMFINIVLFKQNKIISITDFLDLWSSSFLIEKGISVFKDHYFLGLYSSGGKLFTYILLPFDEKQDVDTVMRSWENALFLDTRSLFIKKGTLVIPFFKDALASKIKLRVLEFGKQNPAVLYGKLKNNTILITENADLLNNL